MQIPSKEQVDSLSAELAERGSNIPAHVDTMLMSMPPGTHPMTQFSMAVLALQVGGSTAASCWSVASSSPSDMTARLCSKE